MSPVKRVTFVSSGEYYIGAFKEAGAITEKIRQPQQYSRSSSKPAPRIVKKMITEFQNP